MADDKEINVKFGGSTGDFQSAVDSVKSAISGIGGPIGEIMGSLSELAEAFAAAFAVEKIAEFVEKYAEMGASIDHMSHSLGMSAEDASTLTVAFDAMGLGGQRAQMAMMRLDRNIVQAQQNASGPAAQAFRALGISMEQVKNSSPEQMLMLLADRFSTTQDGVNKTTAAMALLGRTGAQMIPFLDAGRAGLEEFNNVAKQTGKVWSTEQSERAERTSIGVSTLGDAFSGLGKTIFNEVEPAFDAIVTDLITLVENFNKAISAGGKFEGVLEGVAVTAKIIAKTFDDLVAIIDLAYQAFAQFEHAVDSVIAGVEKLGAVLHLVDPDKASKDWASSYKAWDDGIRASIADIKTLIGLQDEVKPPAGSAASTAAAGIGSGGDKGSQVGAMDKVAKQKQEQTNLLQQWTDYLDQKLIAEGNYYSSSKSEELQYWTQQRNNVKTNLSWFVSFYEKEGMTQAQAKQKANDVLLDLDRKVYAGLKENATQYMAAYKSGIDEQVAALKDSLAEKKISEDQWYSQSKADLQDWANLVKAKYTELSPEYNAALKQMEALDKAHLAEEQQTWTKISQTISQSFDTMLKGVLQGTQTWQQAFEKMASDMVMTMIEGYAKILVNDALMWAKKVATATSSDAVIVASDTAKNAATTASDDAAAFPAGLSLKHAASAAQAVFDNVAQIPYVGWILAPPAAAAAFAAVMAFGSFADGAYNVPSDMVAQIHAGEMIVPASISSQIRAGANSGIPPFMSSISGSGGQGTSGGQGGSNPISITFQVQAIDSQGIANFFKSNAASLSTTISNIIRNGDTTLTGSLRSAAGVGAQL